MMNLVIKFAFRTLDKSLMSNQCYDSSLKLNILGFVIQARISDEPSIYKSKIETKQILRSKQELRLFSIITC